MANYVDYDYWVQGYGEGDLSQPDRYVVAGYWVDGYAEYEGDSASFSGIATFTAAALADKFATASITGNATFTAVPVDQIRGSASFTGLATVTASVVSN